jgi:hypothetical protein
MRTMPARHRHRASWDVDAPGDARSAMFSAGVGAAMAQRFCCAFRKRISPAK